MDVDDEIRDKFGAVVCIRDMGNGKSRVVLDDVENTSGSGQGDWRHKILVTFKDYDTKALNDLELTEEEFAGLGHYVLARLLAVKGVTK